MKIFHKAFLLLIVILCLLIGANIFINRGLPNPKIIIRNATIPVELAVTAKEKERGLSGRKELRPGTGMLFLNDHKEVYPYWMKGMRFSLDFVWIDGNKIADLTEHVPIPSGSNLQIIHPKTAVDKILELNAGDIQKIGIQVGDTVTFVDR